MSFKSTANKTLILFFKQKGKCPYCKRSFKKVLENAEVINFDHIEPKSKGGSDKMENLALCCMECNKKKGSKRLRNKDGKQLGVWEQFDNWVKK